MTKIIIKNMKAALKGFALLLLMGITFASCSEESFKGADQNGLPTVDGIDFTLNVDTMLNQISASVPSVPGCYPVWVINGATYSTLNDVNWGNLKRGTYPIELHMANRNGISQASVHKEFTFPKTLVDWSNTYCAYLNGKTWRISNTVDGHIAYGTTGTSGTDKWQAGPNDEEDFGVYDDRLTFEVETTEQPSREDTGDYTYDPGEGGTMYVNKTCTAIPGNPNDGNDFMTPVSAQTATFTLESGTWTDTNGEVQDCVYLTFPAGTEFPYISSDKQWNSPRFRIESVSGEAINLVYDDGVKAWHFILTSYAFGEEPIAPYPYDTDANIWKTVDEGTPNLAFYYAPGWIVIDPGFEHNGNQYTLTYPTATTDRWQNQVTFTTDLSCSKGDTFDFGCVITTDKAIPNATIKLTSATSDSEFFFENNPISLAAGVDNVIKFPAQASPVDMNIKLVFDFGGNPANTTVTIKDIVLQPTVE